MLLLKTDEIGRYFASKPSLLVAYFDPAVCSAGKAGPDQTRPGSFEVRCANRGATLFRPHDLDAIPRICHGDPQSGPIARLPLRERFSWLVSPRNTILQTSPPHAGLCDAPEPWLERLLTRMVR